jgi:hypothetical protein
LSGRLKAFDTAARDITDVRGAIYGHPKENYRRIQALKAIVAECQHPLAREALETICVKISRLIQTPDHLDSWLDISGAARTGVMVTDKE